MIEFKLPKPLPRVVVERKRGSIVENAVRIIDRDGNELVDLADLTLRIEREIVPAETPQVKITLFAVLEERDA